MHPAARSAVLAFAAASLLTACTSIIDAPPENPQSVVNERVAIMKGFAGALGATTKFTQDKGTATDAKTKVSASRAKLDHERTLFPRGTALGDKGVTQSRALTKIFANRADFDAEFGALAKAFATLDDTLARNDKAQTTAALNETKAACKSCHEKYRAAEE